MANFVSPGVYVIEKDISDYPAQINSSVVGIVGFASRGPIAGINNQKATLITSQQGLIDEFGEPSESIKGQALEGALEILESTNSMRFIRCADSTRAEASATAQIGGCPAFLVSGTQSAPIMPVGIAPDADNFGMSAIGSADNTTSSVRFNVTTYDNNRTKIVDNKTFTIVSSTFSTSASEGATTIAALKKVVGGSMDSARIGAFADANTADASSFLVGMAAGEKATVVVTSEILNNAGVWTGMNILKKVGKDGEVGNSTTAVGATATTTSGISVEATSVGYCIKSLWPGAGYNAGTRVDGTTSGVSFEVGVNGSFNAAEQVNNLGVAAESFIAGMTSSAFLENELGTTYDSRTSNYVTANFVSGTVGTVGSDLTVTALTSFEKPLRSLVGGTGVVALINGRHGAAVEEVDPRFVKLIQGTYNLADGVNGIPSTDAGVATAVIGAVQADGGKTGIEALDDPILNVSIALAPGPGVGDNQSIQNGLITVAERTTDFLAALSPPYAIGKPGDAIEWSNGFATTRTTAINSSYATLYWPWVKVFQVFDGKDRWLAPEIYGVRQMCVTDAVADPWFAPAGFVRGRLTKPTDVEVVLNQGDRDSMYSGGNVLNPIVNFPQNGIAIFGQRTTQRQPTALDRINVRRMMIYIKKVILASTQRLVFEPNDKFTWSRVEQLINPLLDDILRRRGITDFKVVCDETTNTPIRVDRNEMWCKVLIKPTKTAEIVIFELNLTSQSAQLG
jgi:phage tail sheath protein FI